MVHIAVNAAAFAIIAKLPLGSVACEAKVTSKGDGPRRTLT
jgi:hypothetical protein